jgi:predicted transcriptional regulator
MDQFELRRWREFLGLSQSDVAKMLSGGEQQFSATDIIDFENGRDTAKVDRVAGHKRW